MKIGIIGLGYVGLPLAAEFATLHSVVGFDIKNDRIAELKTGHDTTLEVEDSKLKSVLKDTYTENCGLFLTSDISYLKNCNFFIVTVPTPVDISNRPDLTPLIKASETVGKALKKNDIVVYESTVYPGATEEDCIPVLEKASGLKFNTDFFVGYSPERINPGDKEHTLTTIKKITSGSTPETAQTVNNLYKQIIKAGTHLAPSIKVAEAAKVIENSQRDINIAFVNELARIFAHLEIDTHDVLEAAGTKWNFLKFFPGLVGGHCIGVDPYYLAQRAQIAGYHPEVILAGRKINDEMGAWIALQVVKLMIKKNLVINNSNILVLGITFKENCPDIRNSKVIDIIRELGQFGCNVDIFDPWAAQEEVQHEYNLKLINKEENLNTKKYSAIVLAVSHNEFKTLNLDKYKEAHCVVYDVKAILDKSLVDGRL